MNIGGVDVPTSRRDAVDQFTECREDEVDAMDAERT